MDIDTIIYALPISIFSFFGFVLALFILRFQRIFTHSRKVQLFAILIISTGSLLLSFRTMVYITGQVTTAFFCWATQDYRCFQSNNEFLHLMEKELTYRNIKPPSSQRPCHIDESEICHVIDNNQNLFASPSHVLFWFNLWPGISSGLATAVTLFYFTRKQAIVGE
ncbi:MAG: hypothetical protein P8183_20915 [Anaerolineae bacterium]|jgi:hypothetical protein